MSEFWDGFRQSWRAGMRFIFLGGSISERIQRFKKDMEGL